MIWKIAMSWRGRAMMQQTIQFELYSSDVSIVDVVVKVSSKVFECNKERRLNSIRCRVDDEFEVI